MALRTRVDLKFFNVPVLQERDNLAEDYPLDVFGLDVQIESGGIYVALEDYKVFRILEVLKKVVGDVRFLCPAGFCEFRKQSNNSGFVLPAGVIVGDYLEMGFGHGTAPSLVVTVRRGTVLLP